MELNFTFKSPDHIRYHEDKIESGPHGGALRIIEVVPEKFMEDNYIVTIYNGDGNHPLWQNNVQMSPKQMKIIEKYDDRIVLRGWGNDSNGQSFADYGLIIYIKDNIVSQCILRLLDRNVYIKYLSQKDLDSPIELTSDKISDSSTEKNGIITTNKIDGEKSEYTYKNGKKEGEWKLYFSNGNIKEIGFAVNDLIEGDWKAFNINGTLRATGKYKYGRQEGYAKFNDENGNLRAEGNFISGQQKGKWIYYDENGDIEDTETL